MTVTDIAQYISGGLALALVMRLLLLRLHRVYKVFCAFLLFDLFSSAVFFVLTYGSFAHADYRIVWMALRPAAWILSLWMVYALVDAVLANLPGIRRLSHKILNGAFVGALLVALLTAEPEYAASKLAGSTDAVMRALGAAFVMERVIFMAALLVLLAVLAFILWFPVQMPRNLAVFSIGFTVFFLVTAALLLARTYLPGGSLSLFSDIATSVLAACYVYWLLFLNRAGETRPVRMGHSWGPAEQGRLVGQLEAMNTALLRSVRR
ncbi:MAG: hypothetical protein JO340_15760 [Acidobacteriaceae bacterium]|nr:hypothetical protein [Acidobacteriaceae bacterium]